MVHVRPVDMKETSQCLLLDRDGEMGQAGPSLDPSAHGNWCILSWQLSSLGPASSGLHSFSGGLPPAQRSSHL